MKQYAFLPIAFLKFWYLESPIGLFKFFASWNNSFLHLFSLPLFLRTFFQPLKNEYREGLVKFSIAMGMCIKSILILIDLLLLLIILFIEIVIFIAFLAFPIGTVWLLFL